MRYADLSVLQRLPSFCSTHVKSSIYNAEDYLCKLSKFKRLLLLFGDHISTIEYDHDDHFSEN